MPNFKSISNLQASLNIAVAGAWLFAHATSWLCAAMMAITSVAVFVVAVSCAVRTVRGAIPHTDCDGARVRDFALIAAFVAFCQLVLSLTISLDIGHISAAVPYTLGYATGLILVSALLLKAAHYLLADFESVAIFA
jgi:hypothetical protein